MRIRVLGCHGGELLGHRTTCFLVDGKLCVDGGAITGALTHREVLEIDDIFLTHSHWDHMKDVPLMTDLQALQKDMAGVDKRSKNVSAFVKKECKITLG